MAQTKQVGDLQVGQDLEFQRREWAVERVGWAVMALLLILALLGLFGGYGPISSATAGERQGTIWLDYDRFMRFKAPSRLAIHLGPGPSEAQEVQIWLSREYLSNVRIQNISPMPDSTEIGPERVIYTFQVAGAGRPLEILFDIETESIGPLSGQFGRLDGDELEFQQFIYP